jgi:hypothetical protein
MREKPTYYNRPAMFSRFNIGLVSGIIYGLCGWFEWYSVFVTYKGLILFLI